MDLFHTHVSDRSIELAAAALRSTFISEGRLVREFESRLEAELGLARPVTVNSGTSALHLALAVAGVGPGDEVILPAQTFVATAEAVLMQRAVPVFADVNPETGNLDPADAARRVTPRTRAIMPVHWSGLPCDMREIAALAARHDLAVVEDAAHALGARHHDKPIGSLSRFTAFSFQAIKHLTTGDGGALCCLDPADATTARRMRWFGIDRETHLPDALGERVYSLDTPPEGGSPGFKYHLNDLAAAVGLGNLDTFPGRLARRRTIHDRYRAELAGVPGVRLLAAPGDRVSACWLFTMRVQNRDRFIARLASHKIPCSIVHRRIDTHPAFGGRRSDLPGQDLFDREQINIPLHEALTDDDAALVVRTIRAGW